MKMKTYSIIAIIFFAVVITSCQKIKDAFFNPIESPLSVDIIIPVTENTASETSLGTSTVSFNLDSIIKKNTGNVFSLKNINSVKIKDLAINLINPDQSNNLANFENAAVTFYTNTRSTPVTIATATIPDSYTKSLIIPTNNTDIKGHLDGTQMTFNLFGKARRATTIPLTARISITLKSE